MTDEELADVLRDAYDSAKSTWWIDGADDAVTTRNASRVKERWLSVARITRDSIESSQRERTAATILAALMHDGIDFMSGPGRANAVREAVALTDALRAELGKVRP